MNRRASPQSQARRATHLLQTRADQSVVLRDVQHLQGPPVECVRCFKDALILRGGAGEWTVECMACGHAWKEKIRR